jgi:spore maturation protein CgeB
VSLPTLTIVVPTIGRLPGLQHTLDSIARQALVPGDRVLVVLDTYQEPPKPHIRALVATYGFEYHEHDGGTHFFGNPQLNHAMTVATADPATTTDFFCALGDDDVYVDGALARIRWQLKPGWVGLVQFYSPPFPTPDGPRRLVLWDDRVLKQAHISGCCLIAPTASLVPVKAERRIEVDFDWIQDVVAKTGHGPLWIDDCVILARPRLVDGHPVRTLAAMRSGLKLLVVHPGASWSTADVEAGLRYGLEAHGVTVVRYRLDERIDRARTWLHTAWRRTKKAHPAIEKPSTADVFYHAGIGVLEMALRHQVDAVVVISAMFLHPDVIVLLRRAGVKVTVLFTESPYDEVHELPIAKLVDGGWTNERSAVPAFRAVNPRMGYLPHGWHPERHRGDPQPGDEAVAAHDVVFVGSAFHERVAWLSAIDWTGIDLGLYGSWDALSSRHPLRRFVREGPVSNVKASALYRRASIGLNLYRTSQGWGTDAPPIATAESLNPRAYELAACGAFSISTARAEVHEVFGDLVPTFQSPHDAQALLELWLDDAAGRRRITQQLPACVAEASWTTRATTVIGDLETLLSRRAA